ncbi:uncharacterized protein C1orf94 homolog isoform X2 [Dendropsophus ebraccatus]|uniref:uncharacterized protein C1orf94 homolog isoform X2 n=1 Tax=Dendropsophus ebraccatus TaxID=150705 RepID=UPI00383175E9
MFRPGCVPLKAPETSIHDRPIGPFPRHAWVHPSVPEDGFDRVCHDIWKQAQNLPEGLKPQNGNLTLKTEGIHERSYNTDRRSKPERHLDDDIFYMVEQEHMNLIIENLSESFREMSIKERDGQTMDERAKALKIENVIKSVLASGNSNKNLTLMAKKCSTQDRSSFQLKRSYSLDNEDIFNIQDTKMEALKLLAQFPQKSADTGNDTITKTDMKVGKNPKENVLSNKESSTCETASKGEAMPMQGAARGTDSETGNRNMKQAGPGFMPLTSSVPEVPANESHMSNFPLMPFFWIPHGMNYGQFQQMNRPMYNLPHRPMIYCTQPRYQMRGFPKPSYGTRGQPRMAGDGPQYRLLHPYRFSPPVSSVPGNNQNLSSNGNCRNQS